MIQKYSPILPLPTGVRRGLPDRRPRVSRIASPSGLTPSARNIRISGLTVKRCKLRTSRTLTRRLRAVSTSRARYTELCTSGRAMPGQASGLRAKMPHVRARAAAVPTSRPRGKFRVLIRVYGFIRSYDTQDERVVNSESEESCPDRGAPSHRGRAGARSGQCAGGRLRRRRFDRDRAALLPDQGRDAGGGIRRGGAASSRPAGLG